MNTKLAKRIRKAVSMIATTEIRERTYKRLKNLYAEDKDNFMRALVQFEQENKVS